MKLSIFLIVFAVLAYYEFYIKTHDLLNPFGVTIFIWNVIAAISSIHLSPYETTWTIEMYIIVLLFPMVVFLTGYIGKGQMAKILSDKNVEFTNTYIILSRMLFLICILCAWYEWRAGGYKNFFEISGTVPDVKAIVKSIKVVHYGTIFLPYLSLCSFFELCYRTEKKIKTTLYLIGTIGIAVIQALIVAASRGTLITMITGMIYIVNRRFKLSIKQIGIACIIVIAGFIYISTKRIYSASMVYSTIPGNPLISAVYSYTALNFENLNKLTKYGPALSGIGRTLLGFLQCIGLGGLIHETDRYTTYFFNAYPLCYDFYDDLWLVGVIIYTFILYKFIQWIYIKSNVDERFTILAAGLQKAIWIVFFGNYFTAYRTTLFPYFLLGILVWSMNVKIKY